MNHGHLRDGGYEHRLLRHLQQRVSTDPTGLTNPVEVGAAQHRRPRTALAAAAAAAVVATAGAAVLLTGGGAAPAYAVEELDGGAVQLTVNGAISDPSALQSELQAAGVRARVVPRDYRGACHPASENLRMPANLLPPDTAPEVMVVNVAAMPPAATLIVEVTTSGDGYLTVALSADGTPACR